MNRGISVAGAVLLGWLAWSIDWETPHAARRDSPATPGKTLPGAMADPVAATLVTPPDVGMRAGDDARRVHDAPERIERRVVDAVRIETWRHGISQLTFHDGRLVAIEGPAVAQTLPTEAIQISGPSAAEGPGRWIYSRTPAGSVEARELPVGVPYAQSIGMGSSARPLPTPRSPSDGIRTEWGWSPSSSLDR